VPRTDLGRIEAVLLDMDGTLVDSDAAVERAWSIWAEEYGVDPGAVLAVAHGSPAARTVRRLLPALDDEAVLAAAQRQHALQYEDLADVTAAPGARFLLATLDRLELPWAVVTSADGRLAKARLHAAGIDPPVLLTIDDVGAGKPDPEGYLEAARRLGIAPSACLVVEDSEPGLAAGRAAGMPTAALRGLDGDLSLPGLGRLAHLLQRSRVRPWWRDAVGYQVYLPSFADSTGDGWGDLAGASARLDHLERLGVEVVWLTPFYRSPMRDHGYDVADYRSVDPSFGGQAALDGAGAGAPARDAGDRRPGRQPHQRRPPVVRRRLLLCGRPAPRLLHLARPGTGRRPAQQLAVPFRRARLDVQPGDRPVLPAPVPSRTARPELAQPGAGGRDRRDRRVLAEPRTGRFPHRHRRLPRQGR
jgi:HAD superfamily hydrolase (TIGR01509 family)